MGRLGGSCLLGRLGGSLALVLRVLNGARRRPLGQQYWLFTVVRQQHAPVPSADCLLWPAVLSTHCKLPAFMPAALAMARFIWGRGTLDIKTTAVQQLEAVNLLLKQVGRSCSTTAGTLPRRGMDGPLCWRQLDAACLPAVQARGVLALQPATLAGPSEPCSCLLPPATAMSRSALLPTSLPWLALQGYQPKRTIHLAFGHDEEVGGSQGVPAAAAAAAASLLPPSAQPLLLLLLLPLPTPQPTLQRGCRACAAHLRNAAAAPCLSIAPQLKPRLPLLLPCTGATAIAALLQKRGVELELVLDEVGQGFCCRSVRRLVKEVELEPVWDAVVVNEAGLGLWLVCAPLLHSK